MESDKITEIKTHSLEENSAILSIRSLGKGEAPSAESSTANGREASPDGVRGKMDLRLFTGLNLSCDHQSMAQSGMSSGFRNSRYQALAAVPYRIVAASHTA